MRLHASSILVIASACGRVDFSPSLADAAAEIDPSLLGWWKLDEGTGTSAADSSGHGNTGVLGASVTWMVGRTPGSVAVSIPGGADNEVDIGDPTELQLTGSMTLAGWVYLRSFHPNGHDDHVIGRTNFQSMMDGGWALKGTLDCGALHYALHLFAAPGTAGERCSNITPGTDSWYHVAGVYDAAAQTMDIYIDGVLDNGTLNGAVPAAVYVPPGVHTQIGDGDPTPPNQVGGPSTLDGLVSDVRIYTRALSAAEVAALASQ